jgi:hypothetical protein
MDDRSIGIRAVKRDDRLFQPLFNLMLFMDALIHTLEAKRGTPRGVDANIPSTLQSDVAEMQIELPARAVMDAALASKKVGEFDVNVIAANMVAGSFHSTAIMPEFIDNIASPQFLLFYETCDSWLHANGFGDYKLRPMTLEFGRTVRNAIAHGGSLEIRNPRAQPVRWHSLSYGPSENGRKVIGTDLYFPDLVALMLEMDEAMIGLGAPR